MKRPHTHRLWAIGAVYLLAVLAAPAVSAQVHIDDRFEKTTFLYFNWDRYSATP